MYRKIAICVAIGAVIGLFAEESLSKVVIDPHSHWLSFLPFSN